MSLVRYWLQWSFSIPSELIAASTILSYWTDALKTWEWSLIIIVPVFLFQFLYVYHVKLRCAISSLTIAR